MKFNEFENKEIPDVTKDNDVQDKPKLETPEEIERQLDEYKKNIEKNESENVEDSEKIKPNELYSKDGELYRTDDNGKPHKINPKEEFENYQKLKEGDLSAKLTPNSTYEIDGHEYKTDDNGNIYEIDGDLLPNTTFIKDGEQCKTDDNGDVYNVNGKFLPNKTFVVNGYECETDDRGLIEFDNLDVMIKVLGKTYKDIKADKPRNSRNLAKWFESGGKIKIGQIDGKKIWTYIDSDGKAVDYIDGYIVFPPEAKHPVIGDIDIGKFTGERQEDIKIYKKILKEEYELTTIPKGYCLHHDTKNGILQLVKEDYHETFKHIGGHSLHKEDNNANS